MNVLLIIPAYNEGASIEGVVDSVIAAGYDYVVVNDGSRDDTSRICHERGFNVLDLSRNLGIGGAVQAGHRYALLYGYDVDIQFDGDGQHDVAGIPPLLKGIEDGFDLVIGSRFVTASEGFKSSALRRAGIKWLRWMIRLTTGQTITDSTSGFRACNRKAIQMFAQDYPVDYPEPESIASGLKRGLRVTEVPTTMHDRKGGASSIGGFSSLYYMVKVSFSILISSAYASTKEMRS